MSMKSLSSFLGSEGHQREFKITWGLRAGYGLAGLIYALEEAIHAAHRWMRGRDAQQPRNLVASVIDSAAFV